MEDKNLKIYFTSDLHSYIYPTDYRSEGEVNIGLFKCANRFHKDGNTLIIDGGDLLQGSPLGAFQHDIVGNAKELADIMNTCKYDFVTLGNHDFNFGTDYKDSYLNNLNAKCVCENVLDENGSVKFPWQIFTAENGLKVGLVGIVTDYVNIWEKPEHLKGIKITDPFNAAKKALADMKDKVDLTICIYHGGFEIDVESGKLLSKTTENIGYRICRELDFDVLLTGHQHMSLKGRELCGTFIVQPTDAGKEFIELDISVGKNGKAIKSKTVPAGGDCDTELLKKFSSMEKGAEMWLDTVVGHMSTPLSPCDRLSMARDGNAIVDFFNEVQLLSSGAQISVASLANEISGLPQVVRRRDVLTVYPYTNTLAVLKVNGAQLKTVLERSAEYFDISPEGEAVISESFLKPKIEHYNYDFYYGIDYTFDIRKPLGERVVSLKFNGKDIAPEDSFSLCLNSYRASGAGGYDVYRDCPVIKEIDKEMSELILGYFKENPTVEVCPNNNMKILY